MSKSLPDRLRDNGAWTGDDALQCELRLDAAMEIERLNEIVDDATRRMRIRREEIDRVERELTRYKRLEAILRNEADADYHEGRQRMNDAMRFLSEWERGE